MINHVRTLLHNVSSLGVSDEYVDPDFVPVEALPLTVSNLLNALLFKQHEDANLAVRQLMQILHTTELEEHVLQYDQRVTYLPFDDLHFDKSYHDLSQIIPTLEAELAAGVPEDVFGDITVEPAKTYYNLWTQHEQLPYKLGGLVLALVAAIERAR